MPTPEHYEPGFLESIAIRFFRATGFHLGSLLKFAAILLIGAVGIGWVLLNNFAENDAKPSGGVVLTRLTSEEKFREVISLPSDFSEKRGVERIDILNNKIERGEELAKSGGDFADEASESTL